ncbi:MAG: hypothetical protein QM786_13585 [Breznakibacter sp.]
MDEKLNNHVEEQRLRELFKSFGPQEAPAGLQKKIMQRVMADWAAQPLQVKRSVFDWKKLWWGLGALLFVVSCVWYDMQLGNAYVETLGQSLRLKQLDYLTNGIRQLAEWFRSVPTVFIYVSLAVAILLGLDNLLGKLKSI